MRGFGSHLSGLDADARWLSIGQKTGFAEISGFNPGLCFFLVFQAAMYRLFLKDIF